MYALSLYLARIGRPKILWSVNKLARAITKWTKACDKRLARLISYIHVTSEFKQYCRVGNTAQQCTLGLFQDSDFAGDLEDSKSTSGGILCIWGSHTFVPISWMCKKQTSVSHSSTESEIISLDASLRMDGFPALDLWDLIIDEMNSNSNQKQRDKQARGDPLHGKAFKNQMNSQTNTSVSQGYLELFNVDFFSSNANSCRKGAMLHIFEDNEDVMRMMIKGRSPTLRHVSRTYRDALPSSAPSCFQAMSKRMQEGKCEERIAAKSKPVGNLVSRIFNSANFDGICKLGECRIRKSRL